MGTGAFKALSGDSAAKYVAEEASKASKEAVTKAFTEMSDSERQRVMKALQSVNMSKATPSEAATPAVPSEKESTNPLGLDFSCFGTKSTGSKLLETSEPRSVPAQAPTILDSAAPAGLDARLQLAGGGDDVLHPGRR